MSAILLSLADARLQWLDPASVVITGSSDSLPNDPRQVTDGWEVFDSGRTHPN
jgi:hypothetical protein